MSDAYQVFLASKRVIDPMTGLQAVGPMAHAKPKSDGSLFEMMDGAA